MAQWNKINQDYPNQSIHTLRCQSIYIIEPAKTYSNAQMSLCVGTVDKADGVARRLVPRWFLVDDEMSGEVGMWTIIVIVNGLGEKSFLPSLCKTVRWYW